MIEELWRVTLSSDVVAAVDDVLARGLPKLGFQQTSIYNL